MVKIAVVYGTRPEAIKVAPLIHALRRDPGIETLVVSTGQHRDMLPPVEELFTLAPNIRLDLMHPGQSLSELFSRVLTSMDAVLDTNHPDIVVVHGDTTTAAAAALSAYHRETPVAHLEAGLRSGDLRSPFPEEGNRRMIARLADVHLAPTALARSNLRGESVPDEQIVITGNTVIDALHWAATRADSAPWPPALAHLTDLDASTRVVLVTLHRRENQAVAIGDISRALAAFARQHPDARIIFPMHRNPDVRAVVRSALEDAPNADLVEPVDYLSMIKLLTRAWLVVTDSGGIQEEAPAFGVPVLVARDTTERPEAITAGVARLVGGSGAELLTHMEELHASPAAWAAMARAVNPFGDGQASARVVAAVRAHLETPAMAG